MMKHTVAAALLALTATASLAHAEAPVTTAATNLVVVTPNAPVVVTTAPAAAAVAAAPAAVATAPAAVAAAPAAPQNEDWNNVSHINGQLVPVGERGAYLYKFRKTNLSANPIGLLWGYFDVSVSHALGQNVALSAAVTAVGDGSSGVVIAGVSAPIYFRRTFSGPFLEPGLAIYSLTSNSAYDSTYDTYGPSTEHTDTIPTAEMMLGWHWMFDSGLNLSAAFGAARRLDNRPNDPYGNTDEILPAGYLRVGYAF